MSYHSTRPIVAVALVGAYLVGTRIALAAVSAATDGGSRFLSSAATPESLVGEAGRFRGVGC